MSHTIERAPVLPAALRGAGLDPPGRIGMIAGHVRGFNISLLILQQEAVRRPPPGECGTQEESA